MEAARLMRVEDTGNIPVVNGERFVCTHRLITEPSAKRSWRTFQSRRNGLSAE
jgi:hypothetical protein